MIRRISFIKRKAGLTTDEFFARWMGRHAELLSQLPGLRGLRFTRIERCTPEAPGWDGLGESWFDSLEDFDRAFATEPLRSALLADREGCIGDSQTCYVEEPGGFTPPLGTSR
jgi:uncharacterized protein (TIGR02118 family)